MRRIPLLLVGVLVAGFALAEEGGKDLKQLQGTWGRASEEKNGQKTPEDELKNVKLTIEGDKYTLDDGKQKRSGTLKLDESKVPKTIDIVSGEGPNKGKTLKGIYKLEGDTFTYCVAPPDKDRPTEFSGKEGSGHVLYVNKRQK